jgi:hypothetical protein
VDNIVEKLKLRSRMIDTNVIDALYMQEAAKTIESLQGESHEKCDLCKSDGYVILNHDTADYSGLEIAFNSAEGILRVRTEGMQEAIHITNCLQCGRKLGENDG